MLLPDGTIMNGVFIFNSSVIFTESDLVIDAGVMYYTIEQSTNETPRSSRKFIDYALFNAVKTVDEFQSSTNQQRPVPSSLIRAILNSYLGGLIGNREVTTLDNGFDLNSIVNNFKGFVKPSAQGVPLNLSATGYYVLECQKSGNLVTQQLLDYQTPNLYMRYMSTATGSWSSWTSLAPATSILGINEAIIRIQDQVTGIKAFYKDIEDNSDSYHSMKSIFEGTTTSVPIPSGTPPDAILYIEVTDGTNVKIVMSSWINTVVSGLGEDITLNPTANTVTISGATHSITKIFVSK